jgi:hypothetical protein
MSHAVSTNPKQCKVFLLGTSALVCFALAAPVMADGDSIIKFSNAGSRVYRSQNVQFQ